MLQRRVSVRAPHRRLPTHRHFPQANDSTAGAHAATHLLHFQLLHFQLLHFQLLHFQLLHFQP